MTMLEKMIEFDLEGQRVWVAESFHFGWFVFVPSKMDEEIYTSQYSGDNYSNAVLLLFIVALNEYRLVRRDSIEKRIVCGFRPRVALDMARRYAEKALKKPVTRLEWLGHRGSEKLVFNCIILR